MRFVVIYTDISGLRREEWSFTKEQALWTLNNLKRLGVEATAYELVEIKS